MDSWRSMTLGDVAGSLNRYRPYLAVVAAIIAIAVLLPGESEDDGQLASSDDQTVVETAGDGTTAAADGAVEGETVEGGTTDVTGGTVAGASSTPGAGGTTSSGGAGTKVAGTNITLPAEVGPTCDTKTGRIKVPAMNAAPCVAPYKGNNGGSTYQGVTGDTIQLVYYRPQANAATTAALTAACAANTPEETQDTLAKYHQYFQNHYETYGRKVVMRIKEGSGAAEDDAAGRADAIDVAKNMKPFAVYGNTTNQAFIKEIAANKILCICTTSQPQELYEDLDPYVGYTPLMASTQGYIHRAEYIGKRMGHKPAKWAGTRDVTQNMSTEKRVYGLLYYETPDKGYKSGIDFFEKELGKYGVTLKERIEFIYPLQQVQEQAGAMIQKLKSAGVNSVIFAGDPLTPAIFTQEATRQRWYPEWILTGSALTDTSLFARTYDQTQWNRAFGVSFLNVRYPEQQGEAYRTHLWETGQPPRADNTYSTIYQVNPWVFFTGIHLAGPNLTPHSWQKGIFSYPVSGRGMVTERVLSFGKHGLWPFTDYLQYDDVTEIWWDPQAQGPDEVGNNATGMYRYVDGGKRYLPGQHPRSDPRVFDANGSPTILTQKPPAETAPDYPHQH